MCVLSLGAVFTSGLLPLNVAVSEQLGHCACAPSPQAPPRPWWAVALLPAGGSHTLSAFAVLPTLPSLLAPLFSCAVSALSSEHVVLVGLHVSEHAGAPASCRDSGRVSSHQGWGESSELQRSGRFPWSAREQPARPGLS